MALTLPSLSIKVVEFESLSLNSVNSLGLEMAKASVLESLRQAHGRGFPFSSIAA